MKLVIAGNPGVEHVGGHFFRTSARLEIAATMLDVEEAYKAPPILRKVNWWLRDKRPSKLELFSTKVLQVCVNSGAEVLLATGIAPILAEHISALRSRGIQVLNFLTDDPWNPAHSAGWFFNALREYDVVFTPREANIGDLRKHGCRAVEYLPFAYPEEWIQPVQPVLPVAEDADIIFAGGADRDRVTWITPLISAGLRVELYGGYWGRYPGTRKCARGFITPRELCSAVARSKIALCLVRRANRDGHSMRSYELPAMKACMLVEHTSEHERMFGAEGQSVLYFRSPDEMVGKAKWLIERPEVRKRLREAVYALITQGTNTYTDRLRQILSPVMSAP